MSEPSASHTSSAAALTFRTAKAEAVIKGDTAIGKTPACLEPLLHEILFGMREDLALFDFLKKRLCGEDRPEAEAAPVE